jgi:hypothetical protein
VHPAAVLPGAVSTAVRTVAFVLGCLLAGGSGAQADPWCEACARPHGERLERLRVVALAEASAGGAPESQARP